MLNTRLILDKHEKGSTVVASRVWARFAAASIGLSFALGQTALGQSQLYVVTDLGTLDRCETCTHFRGGRSMPSATSRGSTSAPTAIGGHSSGATVR